MPVPTYRPVGMPAPAHNAMRTLVLAHHCLCRPPYHVDPVLFHYPCERQPTKPWDTSAHPPLLADRCQRPVTPPSPHSADTSACLPPPADANAWPPRRVHISSHPPHRANTSARSAPAYHAIRILVRIFTPLHCTNISATISYKYHCIIRFYCQYKFTHSSNTIRYLVLAFRTA